MDALDILTLKSFILTLHQLPTISPELQTALQALPSDPKAMLAGIEDIIDQEPLATTYVKYQGLLQAREGVRSKGDRPTISSNPSPNTEQDNIAIAYNEPAQEFETIIEAIENQTLAGMKAIVEKIIQNLHQIPRDTIQPLLESPTHV